MSDFKHDFDDARTVAYDDLVDRFGEERVHQALADACDQRIMQLYDNRDQLRGGQDE